MSKRKQKSLGGNMSLPHIIRVKPEDSGRIFELSNKGAWSFKGIGTEKFLLTDEQLNQVREAGIPFQEIGTGPKPEHLEKLKRLRKQTKKVV